MPPKVKARAKPKTPAKPKVPKAKVQKPKAQKAQKVHKPKPSEGLAPRRARARAPRPADPATAALAKQTPVVITNGPPPPPPQSEAQAALQSVRQNVEPQPITAAEIKEAGKRIGQQVFGHRQPTPVLADDYARAMDRWYETERETRTQMANLENASRRARVAGAAHATVGDILARDRRALFGTMARQAAHEEERRYAESQAAFQRAPMEVDETHAGRVAEQRRVERQAEPMVGVVDHAEQERQRIDRMFEDARRREAEQARQAEQNQVWNPGYGPMAVDNAPRVGRMRPPPPYAPPDQAHASPATPEAPEAPAPAPARSAPAAPAAQGNRRVDVHVHFDNQLSVAGSGQGSAINQIVAPTVQGVTQALAADDIPGGPPPPPPAAGPPGPAEAGPPQVAPPAPVQTQTPQVPEWVRDPTLLRADFGPSGGTGQARNPAPRVPVAGGAGAPSGSFTGVDPMAIDALGGASGRRVVPIQPVGAGSALKYGRVDDGRRVPTVWAPERQFPFQAQTQPPPAPPQGNAPVLAPVGEEQQANEEMLPRTTSKRNRNDARKIFSRAGGGSRNGTGTPQPDNSGGA